MHKIITVSLATLLLLSGTASAQSLYTYGGACVNISRDLSYGSRGADVTQLQQFLLKRNYPGSGTWMVSGFYGRATEAAVRNFQTEQHISVSGRVDSQTRMAIDRVSCGLSSAQPTYTIPWNQYATYPQPYSFNSGYNYGFNPFYQTSPTISSLSSTSGYVGTTITIYGNNFDLTNNRVYFGTMPVYAYTTNGSTLTVTVPSNIAGTVQVYVQNSRGTSNIHSFTVMSGYSYYNQYNYGCGTYSQGSCCGFGVNCPLSISYLNPNSGAVGSTVTVIGSGFSTTGNSVKFGVGIITGLTSPDGRSVSFTVPSQLSGYGSQPVTLGQYQVSVANASGQTSNSLPFTVTSIGTVGQPVISNISGPTTLSVNVSGTWALSISNQNATYSSISVNWGDPVFGTYTSAPQQVYGSGSQVASFSHSYARSGTYTITFTITNNFGQSNTSTLTVNVTGGSQNGYVTLSSIAPTSGYVGTQIALYGSGFSTLDNTVHFGQGGTMHVPSSNGSTIYFTIPYGISPCDLIGYGCSAPTTQVTSGQYPIYVTNSSGASGTLYFQVQ